MMTKNSSKPKRGLSAVNNIGAGTQARRFRKDAARRGDREVRSELPPHLAEMADAAVDEAFSRSYSPDPLIPEKIAALRGPLDSVLRRHGLLIETAIATALEMSGEIEVMVQVAVPVSGAAMQLCQANTADKTEDLTMPVGTDVIRTPILDIVAYYPDSGRLVVASVKRGGGAQGGTAARQDRIELRAAGMILRGMLASSGRTVTEVEVIVVDYYGRSGIVAGRVVAGSELDAFFDVPVFGIVDAMTKRMAEAVSRKVEDRLALLDRPRRPATAPRTSETPDRSGVLAFPSSGRGTPPTLAECFAALPPRPQGRQMAAIVRQGV